MLLSTGVKKLIINDFTDYPVTFRNSAGAVVTTGATASEVTVQGLGTFKVANITTVRGVRSRAASYDRISITAATAAQWAFTAPSATTQVYYELPVISAKSSVEFDRNNISKGFIERVAIDVTTADTAATVLAKLVNGIQFEQPNKNQYLDVTLPVGAVVAGVYSNGTIFNTTLTVAYTGAVTVNLISPVAKFTSVSVAEFSLNETWLRFDLTKFTAKGNDSLSSVYQTVFAPITVTSAFEGVGLYANMVEDDMLETENTVYPYSFYETKRPERGGKYTMFLLNHTATFTDEYNNGGWNSNMSSSHAFKLFVKETSSNEPTIDELAEFVNLSTGTKAYSAHILAVYTQDTATLAQFKANA